MKPLWKDLQDKLLSETTSHKEKPIVHPNQVF